MKEWTVMAVVALQVVAQTTAMALVGGGGSTVESRSRSREGTSKSREAGIGASDRAADVSSSSLGVQEETSFTKGKMAKESENVRCHMGKGGSDCFVKRDAGYQPITSKLFEAEMSTVVEKVNEDASLLTREKRDISVESNRQDKASPIVNREKRSADLARIIHSGSGGGSGGGHQPPTEQSRIAREVGESYTSSGVVGNDKDSFVMKNMEGVKSRMATKTSECSENQPLAETRGLLDGLLGGGGSGGNCSAQGDAGEITETDKQLARAAWTSVEKDYHKLGVTLFTELFTSYPDYIKYFEKMKSSPDQDIMESPRFKKHMVSALFPAVAQMLANLDHPEKLQDQLREIAINHKRRHLARHHFETIQRVMLVALKKTLGRDFSHKTEAAYDKILTVAFNGISTIIETC